MSERNYFSSKRRGRSAVKGLFKVLGILIVVGGLVAAGLFVFNRSDEEVPVPTAEVDHYLTAWTKGDGPGMAAFVASPPADLAATATSLVKSVPGSTAEYTATSVTLVDDTNATANYHAAVTMPGLGKVEWDGTLALVRVETPDGDKIWRVQWRPDNLYPGLKAGERLTVTRTWPARASILGSDGSVLAGTSDVVTIGLQPDRVAASLPEIKQTMKDLLGVEAAEIDAALNAPGVQPNYFVPITTVPNDERYEQSIRPRLAPIPGVFFQRGEGVRGAGGAVGTQLVGTVGEITADRLKELGSPYRVGDTVGLSGLQASYEKRLAGTPSAQVVIRDGDKTVKVLKKFPGTKGKNVKITLDPAMQQRGEAALAGVAQPAALVALDARTGRVLAIVSKPDGGFPRAIEGSYPPGSTFKIVSSEAILAGGSTGATPAPCPADLRIHGRNFRNFEGEASGSLNLAEAFKISCNNSFIGLADKLPADALQKAASRFGFNADYSLGINTAGGSMPEFSDDAERAASAIGQGRVLASPLHMASVAGAVAAGQWHAPVLTSEPKPKVPTAPPIPANILAELRAFMASTVQPGGTAAGAGFPAGVAGKTGTAEFGNGNPPPTHAWFVGYRGNIAFAVVVEGGGVGGRVAAPLAAKFANSLP
jgi:cell division protein FtsI/penicillin-binding protein 2